MSNILYISSSYPLAMDDNITLITPVDNVYTFLYQNFSSSYIAAPETDTQHLYVDSTSGFPSQAYMSVDNEILYYSSASITGSSNNQYILHIPSGGRALFNTTITEHTSQSRAELRVISEYHKRHNDVIIKMQETIGYLPYGYPTGADDGDFVNILRYQSGSNKIHSGTFEERIRFLEWAIIEMVLSGSGITGPQIENGYTGSYSLLSKILPSAI